MSHEMIALVGGDLDGQVLMNVYTDEPELRFKTRDLDDKRYEMGVYNRGEVGADGIQEYVFSMHIVMWHDSLSMQAEDIWLLEQFPDGFRGYAADVGAYDGVSTSNTLLLERKGWTVLNVEPNPWLEGQLKQNRQLYELCACGSVEQESADFHVHLEAPGAWSALKPIKDQRTWHPKPDAPWDVIQVPVRRLETLLRKHEFPRLDVLSIDVEGAEIDVLDGLDLEEWKPKAIVAESWEHVGPIVPYMADRGYRLIQRRTPNDLFLREPVDG